MRLVLLAPPGAGKGTQSRRLSRRNHVPHIETGKILRRAIREETDLGQRAQRYIESGDLVPDEIMVELVQQRLAQPDCASGFILDGFPRTLTQADRIGEYLSSQGTPLDAVIFLDIDDEVVFNRLKNRRVCDDCGRTYHLEARPPSDSGVCDRCGGDLVRRDDDNREAIQHRLEVYREKTRPLLDYYRDRELLVEIDGERPIEEVTDSILEKLREESVSPPT